MKKFLQKKLKNEKGMTLIELLAVIVIIAIIAAIAIPAIGNIIQNSRIDAVKSDALNVLNAASLYEAQEGEITAAAGITIQTLITDGFLDEAGAFTVSGTTSGSILPGLELEATVADVVGTNDIVFDNATTVDINNAPSSSDIRQVLEGGANSTIGTP